MALDESVQGGDAGHLSDHDTLHTLANNRLIVYVNHGATAGTARPQVAGSAAVVAWWDGSVEPSNAVDGDFWADTSNDVVKQKQSGSFVSLSLAAHDLGGSDHNADTLANLNAKVSDATLDDSGDARTPTAHAASHSDGGSDEVSVENLATAGADGTVPTAQSDGSLAMETPSSGSSDAIFLPASEMHEVSGSPSRSAVRNNIWPVWLLDDASDEAVATILDTDLFTGWSTFNIEFWWTTSHGNSGDVFFDLRYSTAAGDGSALTIGSNNTGTFAAPGTALDVEVSVLDSGISVPASGVTAVRVRRLGGDAGDTMTGDAAILGARLVKAS